MKNDSKLINWIGKSYLLAIIIFCCLFILNSCNIIRRDFQTVRKISSISPYQDIRWKDLRKIESQLDSSIIKTFTFNEKTVWPDKYKAYANSLLTKGKNPGLEIRNLHKQGITGKDVVVAIIDQNICLDHPEYVGKIKEYHDVGCNQPSKSSSMHGPAVLSLLVGDSIGTAPEARIYFVAAPSWTRDAKYQADALNWIIDKNNTLPESEKIRAVSISAAPSGIGTPFTKNNSLWDSAYSNAIKAGLVIIDCTQNNGITAPCYYDIDSPDSIEKCLLGFPNWKYKVNSTHICVPTSLRTVAEEYNQGVYSYTYWGQGGLSWAEPYLVGILALGWQLRPDISGQEMIKLLYSTSYSKEKGMKIIQPKLFVESVKIYPKYKDKK
jgi:serine protease AprX